MLLKPFDGKSLCWFLFQLHLFFFINNQKFEQSPQKSLFVQQFLNNLRANKRRKLNSPLREQTKTFSRYRKPKRNAQFWTCQFKSVHCML